MHDDLASFPGLLCNTWGVERLGKSSLSPRLSSSFSSLAVQKVLRFYTASDKKLSFRLLQYSAFCTTSDEKSLGLRLGKEAEILCIPVPWMCMSCV